MSETIIEVRFTTARADIIGKLSHAHYWAQILKGLKIIEQKRAILLYMQPPIKKCVQQLNALYKDDTSVGRYLHKVVKKHLKAKNSEAFLTKMRGAFDLSALDLIGPIAIRTNGKTEIVFQASIAPSATEKALEAMQDLTDVMDDKPWQPLKGTIYVLHSNICIPEPTTPILVGKFGKK